MQDPAGFARDWIESWNARDLERILAHYAPEVVFLSPFAEKVLGDGRVEGLAALRSYWQLGLERSPDLHFELQAVLGGCDCLTILYRNHRGQQVAETMEFDAGGSVIRSFACYSG